MNEVNKTLKLDNDMVMLGSVLPDLTIDKGHRVSHFKNGEEGIEGTANPYKFLLKDKKRPCVPFWGFASGTLVPIVMDGSFYNFIIPLVVFLSIQNISIS